MNQPALAVSLLGPGIRKKDQNCVNGFIPETVLQHLAGIMTHEFQVAESTGCDFPQNSTDAGAMHLDTEKITCGILFRHLHQRGAHAETDFHHKLGSLGKQRIQGYQLRLVVDDVVLPVLLDGLALGIRQTARAEHIAADGTLAVGSGRRGHGKSPVLRCCSALGDQKKAPSIGDDALA